MNYPIHLWWIYPLMMLLTYQSLLGQIFLPDRGNRIACAFLSPFWPYLFLLAITRKILS